MNVQIWNEEVDGNRRYVFFQVSDNDVITAVKVITGDILAQYDRTGTLTRKYQATMISYGKNICSNDDSTAIANWIIDANEPLLKVNPNNYPRRNQLLRIAEVYRRLLSMVGKSISYLDAIQERNRGAELHSMICEHLGYSVYEDDGTYPDIVNQLLEVKLQTSPTIDLGLHSPEDGECIASIDNIDFYSKDVRYAIFDGEVKGSRIVLKNLYLVTGEDFTNYFPLFKGKELMLKSSFLSHMISSIKKTSVQQVNQALFYRRWMQILHPRRVFFLLNLWLFGPIPNYSMVSETVQHTAFDTFFFLSTTCY